MPSQDNNTDQKSHAAAADLYGTSIQKNTPNQRELEAHVLLKSAKFLKDIQKDWDNTTPEMLEETLKYNRQIWMMFYDTALENTEGDRPNDLRSNIINLANFVFKRELDIMGTPEKNKLDVLININREIAAGLMAGDAATATTSKAEKSTSTPPLPSDSITTSA
jgi:flagellar protein FlaF